jgi:hypothetical protein
MINMLLKLYIIFSSILMTLNVKTQNYKYILLRAMKSYDFFKVESCHTTPGDTTK